jgi:hypothetical protein
VLHDFDRVEQSPVTPLSRAQQTHQAPACSPSRASSSSPWPSPSWHICLPSASSLVHGSEGNQKIDVRRRVTETIFFNARVTETLSSSGTISHVVQCLVLK